MPGITTDAERSEKRREMKLFENPLTCTCGSEYTHIRSVSSSNDQDSSVIDLKVVCEQCHKLIHINIHHHEGMTFQARSETEHDCNEFIDENEKTFKDGTLHVEKRCAVCNKFLGWKSQGKPFMFFFGKFKGHSVGDIYFMPNGRSYLQWCVKTMDKKIADRIKNDIIAMNDGSNDEMMISLD